MEDRQSTHDMIDVTDCLEARDAIRGMKNFCFWLMLLSLLILQGLFWLDRAGWVQRGPCCTPAVSSGPDCLIHPVQEASPKSNGENIIYAGSDEKVRQQTQVLRDEINRCR